MSVPYNRECPLIRGLDLIHLTTESCDRPLVELLQSCCSEVVEDNLNDVLTIESAHAVTAWEEIKPCPTHVLALRRKRKIPKPEEKTFGPDISKPSEEGRIPRLNSPFWKCVDTTYRYIPNNGKYRESKGGKRYPDVPRTVRRIVQGRQSVTPEQNILHKQIHRELQNEYDSQGSTAPPTPRSAPVSAPPATRNDCATPRENITLIAQKYSKDTDYSKRNGVVPRHRPHHREGRSGPPTRKTPDFHSYARFSRSRESQQSSNKHSVELPPIEVPLLGKTLRTEYLEVFNNRLSALEEEMRKDMLVFRRTHDDTSWATRNTRGERMRFLDFPGYVAIADTEEPFSVKPLKRLKSKQKIHNLDYKGVIQVKNSNGEIIEVPKYGSPAYNNSRNQNNSGKPQNKASAQSDQALKALRLSEEGFLSSTRVQSPTKKPQSTRASACSRKQGSASHSDKQGPSSSTTAAAPATTTTTTAVLAPHQVQLIVPETLQTFSISHPGSAKKQRSIEQESIDPHLPEVAGKRLEVPVASQRAL